MRKLIIAVTLCCSAFTSIHAQSFLSKVPANAFAVIKYSGDNFAKNVPLQKLDSYGFIRNDLFKKLKIDTLTSLKNIGVDLEQDIYQYLLIQDSATNFVTLVHLKNAPQFLQFVEKSSEAGIKTEKKNGYDFLSVSENTYIGINENTAVIVNTTYNNRKSYYEQYRYSDTTTVVTDSAYAAPYWGDVDTLAKVYEAPKKTIKAKPAQKGKTKAKPASKGKAATAKKKAPVKVTQKKEEIIDEVVTAEDPVIYTYKYSAEDSIENMKRELWDQQQDMITKAKQYAEADKIAMNSFNNTIASIQNDVSYKKIVDPAAHVSTWINSESIWSMYSNYFMRGVYGMMRSTMAMPSDTSAGFRSAANVYFDKDKVRVEQKVFSPDEQLAEMGRQIMNNKQTNALASYVNQGNIGYFSMSINTEAMTNYYYTLMKKYLSSTSYMSEYSSLIDIYIDFLQIAIDEKGLAELMPGNFLFVMHDLKTKAVTYTDYNYDSEYNSTPVKKTKNELSPDFTFVMETKKDGFMQKLANLPVKYAEKERYNYKDKGGYYELMLDSSQIINSLYFIVKDGKAIVTTSKEVIDLTLAGKGFATDADTKKSILNNNYSLRLNSTKMLDKIGADLGTDVNRKIKEYAMANIGDVKMETGIRDGMIQGTTTLDIKGKHANSLEFFFNMFDDINKIIEQDKQEKEKRVD